MSHELSLRNYPHRFGMKLVKLRPKILASVQGKPNVDEPRNLGQVMREIGFTQLSVEEVWHDACMHEVLIYLRGNRALAMPQEIKDLMPSTVPLPSEGGK